MEKKVRDVEVQFGNLSVSVSKQNSTRSGWLHKTKQDVGRDRRRCRSLVSLCVGNLGRHLEDIVDELHLFAPACPPPIKASLLAIARRRGLLSDQVLVALADESLELLDLSGSVVTDSSLQRVAETCPRLRAVDISRCDRLTPLAVLSLVRHCPNIHTLRWGGSILSNSTARSALGYILPKLNLKDEAEESWEELDTKPIGKGVQALRWLVWPSIDSGSNERLKVECPRVVVNPKPFSDALQRMTVPWEARPASVLDAPVLEDIDPETWAGVTSNSGAVIDKERQELSVAERFRLAFVSRDERLAPKRAKNMRQNQRRSEKAWLNSDSEARSRAWAGMTRKSFRGLDG